MKKLNFILGASLMTLFCILSTQSIYAGQVLLRPDSEWIPSTAPRAPVRIALDVTQNDTDVTLSFLYAVGVAQITVENESGDVVYQTAVDTYSTLDAIIDTQILDGGVYTLKISYGSTDLAGEFEL